MPRRSGRGGSPRGYARTARVNELCREILADELERIDDERIELVTVTHVNVDPDLRRATVAFSRLDRDVAEATEALAVLRPRLQAAIGRQARLKRTPELRFVVDDVLARAVRIEDLIREAPPPADP
ncbi:MAG TPA: 30S ribosome-binding factor RbfA [Acidimicrobiales bacterium]|nr:30S ribosome-binding factor RbfA [Acidimicrobiales bacterium]